MEELSHQGSHLEIVRQLRKLQGPYKFLETKNKTLGGNVMNLIHYAGKVFPLYIIFSKERRPEAATGKIKVKIKVFLET